jgi:hypothetical protein
MLTCQEVEEEDLVNTMLTCKEGDLVNTMLTCQEDDLVTTLWLLF